MQYSKYLIAYIIFILAALAVIFSTVAIGWGFFELGVVTTVVANVLIGFASFAIGLLYLFIASKLTKKDLVNPDSNFYIWSLAVITHPSAAL
jgi:hypothetical protein